MGRGAGEKGRGEGNGGRGSEKATIRRAENSRILLRLLPPSPAPFSTPLSPFPPFHHYEVGNRGREEVRRGRRRTDGETEEREKMDGGEEREREEEKKTLTPSLSSSYWRFSEEVGGWELGRRRRGTWEGG